MFAIELLGVIIVLSVIALITVPMVLDVVDEEVPILTAKEEEITIEVGTKVDVKSYFNEPTYGPAGGTLNCDIEDTSLLEAGEHVITCTALGTNGKSVTATKTITVDYEQLVNYTMLYDNGDECIELTGDG